MNNSVGNLRSLMSSTIQTPIEEEDPIYIDDKASNYLKQSLNIDVTPLLKCNIQNN